MNSKHYHLAQVNVARAKAPIDSPVMREFAELLAEINALADASPGFVWRLKTEGGDATQIKAYEDPLMMVNMSVWTDIQALKDYTYKSSHVHVFRKRRDWFEPLDRPSLALWWVTADRRPTVEEARERLELLATKGPSADVFTFNSVFPPPSVEPLTS